MKLYVFIFLLGLSVSAQLMASAAAAGDAPAYMQADHIVIWPKQLNENNLAALNQKKSITIYFANEMEPNLKTKFLLLAQLPHPRLFIELVNVKTLKYELEHLTQLGNVVGLVLAKCNITDKQIDSIRKIKTLEKLNLKGNPAITDAELKKLYDLRKLTEFNAEDTGISKEALNDFYMNRILSNRK